MLKGISPLLSPMLLKVLCEMGHGDTIVIADGNFPAETMGKGGIVIRIGGVIIIRKDRVHVVRTERVGIEEDGLESLHNAFGDRSRFVNAECIYSCKSFDALEVLRQYLLFCEAENAYRKSNACKKVKSLGDHTDKSGYRCADRFADR